MSRWGGGVGAEGGAELAQLAIGKLQTVKASRVNRGVRIGSFLGGDGGLMGDGVGSADLDGDAVNSLNGVSGPGRLDPARASVIG